jgi:transposase-like protein
MAVDLDEVFVKIKGKLCYLWRAVDHEGEVLETGVTAKRDKAAAVKFLKRIMKKYGRPRSVVGRLVSGSVTRSCPTRQLTPAERTAILVARSR